MASEKRLIDAEKLWDAIDEAIYKYGAYDKCEMKTVQGLMEAKELVYDAPTVDAVEVVRCKDCEKWKCHGMPFDITKGTCYNPRFHFHHGHVLDECFMPVTNETDFCSYGERRSDHV